MKTSRLVLILIALVVLNSCNSKPEEHLVYSQVDGDVIEENAANESSVSFASPAIANEDDAIASYISKPKNLSDNTPNKKKIIKDGNISVKTNDINTSKKGFDEQLKKLNAYYESEDLENNDQTISYNLKIRVPADNFEKLISSIENGIDEIKSKSIQARDVTEEFFDIETRLANKREYLKRYKELLSKASTVKDILAIEENIRILQEEIESKEGRLKYLNDQVSFSTLDINLYEEKEFVYKPQPQDKFSERVKKSLSNGWASVVDFVLWSITIWPHLILTLVSFFAIRRIVKKRKSKQS